MQRETVTRARDAAVTIGVIEPFVIRPETDVRDFEHGLAVGSAIGAKVANITCFDGEKSRRAETFASFCALADHYGLKVTAEFFALSKLNSLGAALVLDGNANIGGAECRRPAGLWVTILHAALVRE